MSLIVVPQLPRPDYSPTEAALTHPNAILVLLGVLLVGSALGAAMAHAKRPAPWSFAVIFAAATFAPVSNLLIRSGIVIAERTLYAPSVGTALLEGAVLAVLGRTKPRLAVGALVAVLLVASYRGYALSATQSDAAEDHTTARRYYGRAIGLFSRDPNVLQGASANALLVGDTALALTYLIKAVSADPADTLARRVLARLLVRQRERASARPLLRDDTTEFPKK